MEVGKYLSLKEAGTVKLVAVGPNTAGVFTTKFDADTGKPNVVIEQFNLQQLDDSIVGLQKEMDALKQLRADIALTLQADATAKTIAAAAA